MLDSRGAERQCVSEAEDFVGGGGRIDGGAGVVDSGRLGQIPRGLLGRRLAAMAY